MFKDFNSMHNSECHGNQKEKALKLFLSKTTGQISKWSLETLYTKFVLIGWKTWPSGSVATFPYVDIGTLYKGGNFGNVVVWLV